MNFYVQLFFIATKMADYCVIDYVLRDGTDTTVVRIDWGEELIQGTCKSCSTEKYILPKHLNCADCFVKVYKPVEYENPEHEYACTSCHTKSKRRLCEDCKYNQDYD